MIALIAVSVILLVLGFVKGFEANDGRGVDNLLRWAYVMLGIAVFAAIIVSAVVSFINNPKSVVKLLIGLVAVAAVCFVVYLVSKGNPAVGLTVDQPSASTLKLTDTILNLTYLVGGVAIASIIVGEVISAIRNKK
ncbi:MAG: hypothetical protein IKI70_01490 [Bacteroidales bacterium]|nr:hypothetical protein [Bacteroidales bacterium]MBR3284935.1 hypothetical protein [Bacteroidales bacterium]